MSKFDGKKYKVHFDGYKLLPWFKGEVKELPPEGDHVLRVRDLFINDARARVFSQEPA